MTGRYSKKGGTSVETEKILKVNQDVILREIAGECFLIPTGKTC